MSHFIPQTLMSKRVDDNLVGLVDDGGVERGEVDAGGLLGVVAHGLADDAHGDVLVAGYAGPGVACYIQSRYI